MSRMCHSRAISEKLKQKRKYVWKVCKEVGKTEGIPFQLLSHAVKSKGKTAESSPKFARLSR